MKKRIAWGLAAAVALATLWVLLFVPGCGWVDLYLYLVWGCEVAIAGGGGSGAGL